MQDGRILSSRAKSYGLTESVPVIIKRVVCAKERNWRLAFFYFRYGRTACFQMS